MFTRSRVVRNFAALGTAAITAAGMLALTPATATADDRIATSWRVDGAPDPTGPASLTLVRADDSGEIPDATGDVTETFSGPAGNLRRYALVFDYFNPSQNTAVATGTSGGVTTITATHSYTEPGPLTVDASYNHVMQNAAIFGETGVYTGTATYGGDARYRDTTYAYEARLDRLEDLGMPTALQPASLTIDASEGAGGAMPFTVTSDKDLSQGVVYQCAKFDAPQAYWNPEPATASGLRDFSGSCDLDSGYSGAVVVFVLSMDGPGEIIIVDPTTGGTNAGVDPADSLAPGHQVTVSGTGLEPDHPYEIFVESTPRLVGTFTTNSSGAFSGQITIPDDLGDGGHDLVLRDGTTGAEIQRTPFTFSQRADPTRVVTIDAAKQPADPVPAPGSSIGSLGALLGSS